MTKQKSRRKMPAWQQRLKDAPKFWGNSLTILFGAIAFWGAWKMIFLRSNILPIIGIILILLVVFICYQLLSFFNDKK